MDGKEIIGCQYHLTISADNVISVCKFISKNNFISTNNSTVILFKLFSGRNHAFHTHTISYCHENYYVPHAIIYTDSFALIRSFYEGFQTFICQLKLRKRRVLIQL